MKLPKILILPLTVLLLASCQTNESTGESKDVLTSTSSDTSEVTSQDDTSLENTSTGETSTKEEETSQETTTEVETSKETTTETSTSEETTSGNETLKWSSVETDLMHQYLEGMEVPYAPISGAHWFFDESYGVLSYVKEGATLEDCKAFVTAICKYDNVVDVYKEEPDGTTIDGYYRELEVTVEEYKSLRLAVYMLDETTFNVDAFPFIFESQWNETKVQEVFNEVCGQKISLTKPSFAVEKYYFGVLYSLEAYAEIYFYTPTDCTEAYRQDLINANYEVVEDEDVTLFIDPTGTYFIETTYNFNIHALSIIGYYIDPDIA